MSNTEFLKRLGIQHPVIQAPMVGVSTPQLAAAVTNAGGLGSIGIGASTAQQAREMIRVTQGLTSGPFNVNVFCHQPPEANVEVEAAWLAYLQPFFEEFNAQPPAALKEAYTSFLNSPETLEVLLETRPAVVSFHFGLPPRKWIESLRAVGIVTLACATTPNEAVAAEKAGVDAIVAQGVEAGGHRGVFDPKNDREIGTFALIPLLAKACRLPIVAAGGIMNGQGIAAALKLGAAAVQMGTAFILCPESAASGNYRKALQSELANHTQISRFISGRAARGLPNRFFTDPRSLNAPLVPDYPRTYDATKALIAAAANQGSHDFAVQWAGQGAPLARALPAAELIGVLVSEMEAT